VLRRTLCPIHRRLVVPSIKLPMLALLASTMPLAGCSYTPTFGFPIEEGDVVAGRQAFVDHQCHQCHSVAGERMPELAGASAPILELGGETTVARNYAELMTSIINPRHAISESYRQQLLLTAQIPLDSPMPMPHIDNMTVRQLIDLVAFLDSKYRLIEDYDE
jgi:sulfur-oxidizing protein SoxX